MQSSIAVEPPGEAGSLRTGRTPPAIWVVKNKNVSVQTCSVQGEVVASIDTGTVMDTRWHRISHQHRFCEIALVS